jgi:hypothetical protein
MADGRLVLSPAAERAIDTELKRLQAFEKTTKEAKPVETGHAAVAGLVVGLIVGVAVAGATAYLVSRR